MLTDARIRTATLALAVLLAFSGCLENTSTAPAATRATNLVVVADPQQPPTPIVAGLQVVFGAPDGSGHSSLDADYFSLHLALTNETTIQWKERFKTETGGDTYCAGGLFLFRGDEWWDWSYHMTGGGGFEDYDLRVSDVVDEHGGIRAACGRGARSEPHTWTLPAGDWLLLRVWPGTERIEDLGIEFVQDASSSATLHGAHFGYAGFSTHGDGFAAKGHASTFALGVSADASCTIEISGRFFARVNSLSLGEVVRHRWALDGTERYDILETADEVFWTDSLESAPRFLPMDAGRWSLTVDGYVGTFPSPDVHWWGFGLPVDTETPFGRWDAGPGDDTCQQGS